MEYFADLDVSMAETTYASWLEPAIKARGPWDPADLAHFRPAGASCSRRSLP